MDQELDYAEMLEIPVSTVSVVKKKSFFKRKPKDKEDLKDRVVESVNERIGEGEKTPSDDYIRTENLSDVPKMENVKAKDDGSKIVFAEAVALCLIAGGIFLTNIFVPNTVINTFMGGLNAVKETEATYNQFELTPVVSERSDAEMTVTPDGVMCFTDETPVYPVCAGEVVSVTEANGLYTAKIAHTSTFSSVVTGLKTVYSQVGEEVAANIPFAYSDGASEVRVTMYDGETMLNCYTMSGVVPVWNS